MSTQRKVQVVLKTRMNNVPLFLALCKSIYASMTAHLASYSGAPVTMATFQSQIQALDTAQTEVKTRTIGAAAARDLALDALAVTVEALRGFVQGLCTASPEQAVTLVQNAGMKIAADKTRDKPVLGLKQGLSTGVVILSANAKLLKRAKGGGFYNWAYSADGKNWVSVPSTPKAKTTISGLQALTTYGFRVSLTDNDGQGDWSQVVQFLVH